MAAPIGRLAAEAAVYLSIVVLTVGLAWWSLP